MLTKIDDKIWRRAAQAVMALLAVLVFMTFRHYGISWDEEVQSQYGQAIYDYYNSGFVDHRYNQIYNLYLYGGMFDGFAAWLNAWSPLGIYATRHLLNALVGLLGLWGTWRLGRIIGGGRVGLAAMIILALTPMYYGHMFNNPKDIPFAAGVVWTLYYMCRILRYFPGIPWRLIIKLGLVLGLTLGVRVGGIMLLGYWGLVLLLHSMAFLQTQSSFPRKRESSAARLRGIRVIRLADARRWIPVFTAMTRLVVPVALLSYAVMLFCWPWAQEAPIANPWKALAQFSNFPNYVEVLLNGVTYPSTELPWYYVPVYFGAQLPLPQLFLILAGIGLLPHIWRSIEPISRRFALLLVLLTALVPILYATTRHPALYDAVRHFIFTLPLLSILAALALIQIIKYASYLIDIMRINNSEKTAALAISAVFVIALAQPALAMIRLHPYEYIYLNPLEGGVKGGFGHYELDYWGSSFKEAAEKLQEYVNKEGGVPPGMMYRIAICGPWSAATVYLPPDYDAVVANETAEFFLSTTRWQCQNMRPGKEIISVRRMGAPLSVIKDLRGEKDYKHE